MKNLSEEEHNALLEFSTLDDIIIQKADKGNVIVSAKKTDYIQKMEDILMDTSKFQSMYFSNKLHGNLRHLLDKEEEVKIFFEGS